MTNPTSVKKLPDSFIFYRSYYEAICDLPTENQISLLKSIIEYSLNRTEGCLKGIELTLFKLIKPQIDANYKKFLENRKKKEVFYSENKYLSESEIVDLLGY